MLQKKDHGPQNLGMFIDVTINYGTFTLFHENNDHCTWSVTCHKKMDQVQQY